MTGFDQKPPDDDQEAGNGMQWNVSIWLLNWIELNWIELNESLLPLDDYTISNKPKARQSVTLMTKRTRIQEYMSSHTLYSSTQVSSSSNQVHGVCLWNGFLSLDVKSVFFKRRVIHLCNPYKVVLREPPIAHLSRTRKISITASANLTDWKSA